MGLAFRTSLWVIIEFVVVALVAAAVDVWSQRSRTAQRVGAGVP